jgi:hypothetical protein
MPFLADYVCKKCETVFEFMKMGEEEVVCKECGSADVYINPQGKYGTANDPEKRNDMLKKRSADDNKKNFKRRWDRARNKYPSLFKG